MTVANAFVPKPSDPRMPDARPQEPSMEDILASIRRIIADDQMQASRPGYGGPRRVAPSPGASMPALDGRGDERPERSPVERPKLGQDHVLDVAPNAGSGGLEPGVSPFVGRPSIIEEAAPTLQASAKASIQPATEAEDDDAAGGSVEHTPSYRRATALRADAHISYDDAESAEPEPEDDPAIWANDETGVSALEEPAVGEALMSPVLGASVMSAFETLAATVVLQNTEMLERIMRELLRPLVKTWLDENLPTLVERLVRKEIERVARGGRG